MPGVLPAAGSQTLARKMSTARSTVASCSSSLLPKWPRTPALLMARSPARRPMVTASRPSTEPMSRGAPQDQRPGLTGFGNRSTSCHVGQSSARRHLTTERSDAKNMRMGQMEQMGQIERKGRRRGRPITLTPRRERWRRPPGPAPGGRPDPAGCPRDRPGPCRRRGKDRPGGRPPAAIGTADPGCRRRLGGPGRLAGDARRGGLRPPPGARGRLLRRPAAAARWRPLREVLVDRGPRPPGRPFRTPRAGRLPPPDRARDGDPDRPSTPGARRGLTEA